jgi:DNA-binding NarL/FixJ family response regulator
MRTLRISIVEDDPSTRDALVTLLNGEADTCCVCAFGSVEQALASPARDDVDVILLDVDLPGINGADGIGLLRHHWPAARALMLAEVPDPETVFQSICNGAVGHLLKRAPARRLLSAIRDAANGGAPMSPEVVRNLVDLVRRQARPVSQGSELSRQERRVLQLLADGFAYGTAGRQMGISVNTVRSYVRSIYEKLRVTTKAQAVSHALRAGLIH